MTRRRSTDPPAGLLAESPGESPSESPSESPIAWCREQLLVPGHPLALTLPYAAPELRDRLVALHALVGGIAAVPGEVTDPGVARQKLAWWRQALAEQMPHPAVRAWVASGAAERLPAARFDPLIDAVASDIQPPRFERTVEFNQHCRDVAGPAALLEAELTAGDIEATLAGVLTGLAGAAYRIRVARDAVLDARQDRWLIPLEMQAEFQLTRQQAAAGEGGRRLDALIRHMAAEAVLEIERSAGRLDAATAWRHRHLLLRFHVDRNLGRRLVRHPARVRKERVVPGRLSGALSVWRRARWLRRAAARAA